MAQKYHLRRVFSRLFAPGAVGLWLGLLAGQTPGGLPLRAAYVDSLIQARYGDAPITARATYVERLNKNHVRWYRLLAEKGRGVWIIDMTERAPLPVVGFLSVPGGTAVGLATYGPFLYCLEENPLRIGVYDLYLPPEPSIRDRVAVPGALREGEHRLALRVTGAALQVLAVGAGERVLASYDLGQNPARLRRVEARK
jgi:hypothetical protein